MIFFRYDSCPGCVDDGRNEINEQISQSPYQSMISTYNYGMPSCRNIYSNLIVIEIGNFAVKFTALEYTITSKSNFYFIAENNTELR